MAYSGTITVNKRKGICMKKVILLILLSAFIASVACKIEKDLDYHAIIDSTDYRKQVDVLPLLLENEKFEELFPTNEYESSEISRAYDNILEKYLFALIETGEDDLLKKNIVEIVQNFRNISRAGDALIRIRVYHVGKLEIIIPEMLLAYENIDEYKLWERRIWATHIWTLYFEYNDESAEKVDDLIKHLEEELWIAIGYERQIHEGEIALDDVPQRYRLHVERLIMSRHGDSSSSLEIDW